MMVSELPLSVAGPDRRVKVTLSPEVEVAISVSGLTPKVTPDAYARVLDARLMVCVCTFTVSVTLAVAAV